ncbi:MAG: hypothetical protein AAGA68_25285 [Pseudomonadota bacterium]
MSIEADDQLRAHSWNGAAWNELGPAVPLRYERGSGVVGLVPDEGPSQAKLQLTLTPLQAAPAACLKTWNCTLTASDLGNVYSDCWYTCIFASDAPASCSGLSPGVTVGGHDTWVIGSVCPSPIVVTK